MVNARRRRTRRITTSGRCRSARYICSPGCSCCSSQCSVVSASCLWPTWPYHDLRDPWPSYPIRPTTQMTPDLSYPWPNWPRTTHLTCDRVWPTRSTWPIWLLTIDPRDPIMTQWPIWPVTHMTHLTHDPHDPRDPHDPSDFWPLIHVTHGPRWPTLPVTHVTPSWRTWPVWPMMTRVIASRCGVPFGVGFAPLNHVTHHNDLSDPRPTWPTLPMTHLTPSGVGFAPVPYLKMCFPALHLVMLPIRSDTA